MLKLIIGTRRHFESECGQFPWTATLLPCKVAFDWSFQVPQNPAPSVLQWSQQGRPGYLGDVVDQKRSSLYGASSDQFEPIPDPTWDKVHLHEEGPRRDRQHLWIFI